MLLSSFYRWGALGPFFFHPCHLVRAMSVCRLPTQSGETLDLVGGLKYLFCSCQRRSSQELYAKGEIVQAKTYPAYDIYIGSNV